MQGDKLFIEALDCRGKLVVVRCDFNVPLKEGGIRNDERIVAALPTIDYLRKKGARILLLSHLGRPKGKVVEELRLAPVAKRLKELIGSEVAYCRDCIGTTVKEAISHLQAGELLLLENIRFYPGETTNDPDFSRQLANDANFYVNDAFGSAHRAHASTVGITKHVERAAMGYLLKKELDYLHVALENPKHPYIAISGGSKISGKIDLIQNLLPKVDKLLLGGGMVYTFLRAQGLKTGLSLVEEEKIALAETILKENGAKIELPVDFVASPQFDSNKLAVGATEIVPFDRIPQDYHALDIGPKTVERYRAILLQAKTILWNGPMGVFEAEATAKGTVAIAQALAEATSRGAITIIGGGDSAAAIRQAGVSEGISHISTGGGALLEALEGRVLPGVAALNNV